MRQKKIRFLYMVITGILIAVVMNLLVPDAGKNDIRIRDMLISVFITIMVWEGNLRIDTWMNKKVPWLVRPWKRIFMQLMISVAYSAPVMFFPSLIYNRLFNDLPENQGSDEYLRLGFIVLGILVLFSLLVISIEIGAQFFRNWKTSLIDVERIRAENLQARLQNLINQINPHFLFNNLSVLSSLVYKDQDKAVDFINQLSKVYRYLLDTRDRELVTVEQELSFIRSYFYLLKIRFEEKIQFHIDVPDGQLSAYIPQMALQILVENAMKHNESSGDQPLMISIAAEKDLLVVKNNLRLRPVTESGSKTGLQNIRERYKFFTEIPVEISEGPASFIVKIPILYTK